MTLHRRAILGLAWVLIAPSGASAQVPGGASAQPGTLPHRPESCVGPMRVTPLENASQAGASTAFQTSAAPAPTRIQPAKPNAAAVKFPQGADSALIAKLKEGGYVIFFRHAPTNWAERDVTEGDFENRVHQRNLSEVGQRVAVGTGMAIKVLEIPIEKVVSSPMWRCRDTAQFAFGDYDTTSLLFWKGPKFREARIQMLSTSPAAGKNLVLVGHQDQLIPIVPGLRRDELKEGDALVIQPLGKGKFKVVAQVTPADWMILAHVEPPTGDPLGTAPPAATAAPPDSAKGSSRVDER